MLLLKGPPWLCENLEMESSQLLHDITNNQKWSLPNLSSPPKKYKKKQQKQQLESKPLACLRPLFKQIGRLSWCLQKCLPFVKLTPQLSARRIFSILNAPWWAQSATKSQEQSRGNEYQRSISNAFLSIPHFPLIISLHCFYPSTLHCRRWIFRGLLSTMEIQTRLIVVLEYH